MDGLDPDSYDRLYGDRYLLRRIVGYFRPVRRAMLGAVVLIVLSTALNTATPVLLARGIDRQAGGADTGAIARLVAVILVAGVLAWTINYIRQRLTARIIGDVALKVRRDAFAAVLSRDLSFYDEQASGKIISRVTSDTESFATVVTLVLNTAGQALLVVVLAALLLVIEPVLALVTLAIAPLVVAAALGFRRIARAWVQRSQRVAALVNANISEAIRGIGVAKSFRQEQAVYDEFRGFNAQAYAVNLRTGFLFSGIFPLLGTITALGIAAVIFTGGRFVLDGRISAGSWFLFLQALNLFWFPLTSIAAFWSLFQRGLAAGERIFALIDSEPRVRQIDRQPVGRLSGRIEFENVHFRYTEREAVLSGFDLTIAAGETVALVGHTGAGKSTLGKLVARFYEFDGGRILIDNRDIRTLDLETYRRQLGIVGQTPFLFTGTVADNIRYPRPEATDAEVEAAARRVGGGDWLEALPQGLATAVGEGGRALSLGQRQLVALARLLLQDPAIVILDEATASVDPLTEAQIQEGLNEALRHRTAIIIAHRLTTIEHAGRIIVLDQGQIVETGTHQDLMATEGAYAALYNTYFRHQSPDYDVRNDPNGERSVAKRRSGQRG